VTITNGYVTATEAHDYVGELVATNQTQLNEVVTAVSRQVDGYCERHFWQVTETRIFTLTGKVLQLGTYNDLVAATTLAVDGVAVTGYTLGPINRSGPEARPYRWVSADTAFTTGSMATITGTWGWPAIPAAVKQACLIQVSRVFKRAESPLGVAGFGEFGVVRINQLDPDVRALLAPYRIHAGFA
jgi:hypothetical protein